MRPEEEPETLEQALGELKAFHDAQERYQVQMKRFKDDRTSKNAMIVLQNLRLRQQNRKLSALGKLRSKKKERSIRLLSGKHGRHLTGPVFRAAVALDAHDRELKEKKKDLSKQKRELGKQRREWVAKERRERLERRAQDLEQWQEEKDNAEANGQRKPRKPPAPQVVGPPDWLIWHTPEPSDNEDGEEDEEDGEEEEMDLDGEQ
jgi:hypothetical protein